MNVAPRNIVASLVFIGIGVLLLYSTYFAEEVYLSEGAIHPMNYPRALLIGWIILSCLHVFSSHSAQVNMSALLTVLPSIGKVLLCLMFFIIVTPYIGFSLASACTLLGCLYVLGYPKPLYGVAITVLTVFTLWLLFQKMIGFPLPVGSWTSLS